MWDIMRRKDAKWNGKGLEVSKWGEKIKKRGQPKGKRNMKWEGNRSW